MLSSDKRSQWLSLIISSYASFVVGMTMMFPNFFQFKPEHRCESPFDQMNLINSNLTFDQIKSLSDICDQGKVLKITSLKKLRIHTKCIYLKKSKTHQKGYLCDREN